MFLTFEQVAAGGSLFSATTAAQLSTARVGGKPESKSEKGRVQTKMSTNEQGVVSTAQSAELHSMFHSQKQGPSASSSFSLFFCGFSPAALLMASIRNTTVFRRAAIDINH